MDEMHKIYMGIANAWGNGIAISIMKGAARGRLPSWQVAKSVQELQNLGLTMQFGDPQQYLNSGPMGLMNNMLPQGQQPQSQQLTIADIKTAVKETVNEELDARGV